MHCDVSIVLYNKTLLTIMVEEYDWQKEQGKWQDYQNQDLLEEESASSGKQSVIIEIRAGTGGDESGLFARDLFRVYSKYGQTKGWGQKILDSNLSEIGGYKSIIFELSGKDVFDQMQYEGGVHRVQRVPKTEKQGRVHTSTITVAVMSKPKKTQININPADLKVDTYKAGGPGGQYTNKTESAIRITHMPTGIVVTCQSERNQLKNRETAMSILSARIMQAQEEADLSKLSAERREQVGWAKRAEKIRTYNFPQNRLTDHRINKSWHNLESIMEGDLEPVIKAFKNKDKDSQKNK
jgi:peptide chain release factor 1